MFAQALFIKRSQNTPTAFHRGGLTLMGNKIIFPSISHQQYRSDEATQQRTLVA